MFGKSNKSKGSFGSKGGSGSYLTPKNYMNTRGPHKGMYQKPNNDGNLFTRRSPNRKPGYSGCFITTAVTKAAGLPDDCYELSVLRMFRREYVAELPDGDAVLREYHEKAPRLVQAIDELPEEDSRKVWDCLYVSGIVPSVLLITAGHWDEAYQHYLAMCGELEYIFLEDTGGTKGPKATKRTSNALKGHDLHNLHNLHSHHTASTSSTWVDDWVEAKLIDTSIEALDAAAQSSVVPLEHSRCSSRPFRLPGYMPNYIGPLSKSQPCEVSEVSKVSERSPA